MKKNTASQTIGVQGVAAADGTAFTSTVTVYVTGDAGMQAIGSVGSGICTHEGNGYHSYAPAQAETDYDHIAFTFIGTGMIPATVQVFTTFPQTGDAFARVGAPAGASVSADVAAVKVDTAAILLDTGTDGVVVASLAAGSVTAAAIATDAIDADALAADAVTEIQSGLATPTNITAATGIVLAAGTHTGAVIPTVTTLTGHTAQTGDTYALANGATGFAAIDTVVDAVKAVTDGIANRVATGTCDTGGTTTSIVTSSLTPSAVDEDQFKGKIVTFHQDTTTAGLRNQSTDITASSTGGVLTVTALTQAPASGDTFDIT